LNHPRYATNAVLFRGVQYPCQGGWGAAMPKLSYMASITCGYLSNTNSNIGLNTYDSRSSPGVVLQSGCGASAMTDPAVRLALAGYCPPAMAPRVTLGASPGGSIANTKLNELRLEERLAFFF